MGPRVQVGWVSGFLVQGGLGLPRLPKALIVAGIFEALPQNEGGVEVWALNPQSL